MCGIAGICRLTQSGDIPIERITRMIGAQQHRGPDESGLYRDEWIALGHSRLSIVDLAGGLQPIHNEDESLWIIYNGEVYNHPELRRELEAKGHCFYTHCDTEVILHLYEERGPSCVNELNGQFAFAIWDARNRKLFLARDRLGVRPLHYAIHDNELIFASEIKAIFAACDMPRRLDPIALDQMFTVWTTLPGRTAFEDVNELPPGHHAMVSGGRVTIEKYWSPPFRPAAELAAAPFEELRQEAYHLLLDAVRIRLRADVTVGSYLSGGLDSSGVTALIAKNFDSHLRTFGIRFEEDAFDEGHFQQLMVRTLNVDHRELWATNAALAACFPDVVWHCEKPLLRTAPAPLFLLSRMVRDNGIKVVLTGEGSDEFFGGYDIFRETMARRFLAREAGSERRTRPLAMLYPDIFRDPAARRTHVSFFGRGLDQLDDPLFSHRIRWDGTLRNKVFFSDELRSRIGVSTVYDQIRASLPADFSRWPALSQSQFLESTIFLSHYLLSSQGDRVAMANSVEGRYPFLDYRIIEFAAALPPHFKMNGLNEKYILKKMMHGRLPESVLKRPKQAYRSPVAGGFFSPAGLKYVNDLLCEKDIVRSGLFRYAAVEKLVGKVRSSSMVTEVENMALSGIISTQLLVHQYVFRDSFRPALHALKNCRICKEENAHYR